MIYRPLYVDKIMAYVDTPFVKILTGVRRCGKSTILKMIMERLKTQHNIPEGRIVSCRYDSMEYEDMTAKQMYAQLKERLSPDGKTYLFLDEVQEIKGWEKVVNSLASDFDVDLYVTGSNSRMMSSEISTYLTGRYVSFRIFTLSFGEYLMFKSQYTEVGEPKAELAKENVPALEKGIENLRAHVENMHKYNVPVVVAINRFGTDTDAELKVIDDCCKSLGVEYALSEVFAKGGEGGVELAKTVCKVIDENPESRFAPIYDLDLTVEEKIRTIAQKIYGADDVTFTNQAMKSLKDIKALGGDALPVCIAKTQYSLSDDPTLLGRPTGFNITIRDLRLSNGAGFVVAYAGDVMTMPGLPKVPSAEKIDVDGNGVIHGLF